MTREAFIQSKRRNWYGVALPALLALALVVLLPFVWYGVQNGHPDLPPFARIVGHAVCIGALALGGWFVYVHLSRIEARHQHWCPHCQRGFGGTEQIVLKTGKCHHCGFQVIDDVS